MPVQTLTAAPKRRPKPPKWDFRNFNGQDLTLGGNIYRLYHGKDYDLAAETLKNNAADWAKKNGFSSKVWFMDAEDFSLSSQELKDLKTAGKREVSCAIQFWPKGTVRPGDEGKAAADREQADETDEPAAAAA